MNYYQSQVFTVTEQSQIGEVRRFATALAIQFDYPENIKSNVAIVATEIASNLIKHTEHGGEVIIRIDPNPPHALEILAVDNGPGIGDIALSLTDGYSTKQTLGGGLGAIRRLSSVFDIYSMPGKGTVLCSQISPAENNTQTSINLTTGVICLPLNGETVCGDSWVIESQPNRQLFMVTDGLGHGAGAHEAAIEAICSFKKYSHLPIESILKEIHQDLRKTRGAALSIAALNQQMQTLEFVGLGNVTGLLLTHSKRRSLLTLNGIVGHAARKIQATSYPFLPGNLLIMFSDGLGSRFDLDNYPELLTKHPSLIAGVLYRDFSRRRDDVTVLVAKLVS